MKAIYIQSKQWRIYYHVLFIAMTFIHSEIFFLFIFYENRKNVIQLLEFSADGLNFTGKESRS